MVATSPLASLLGGGGDPPPRNLSPEQNFLVRDAITGLIGKGVVDFKDQHAKNAYSFLRNVMGNSAAQKLITQAISFNGRSDTKSLPMDRKVQAFYDLGSNDPETHGMLMKMRSLEHGPVAGLNSSPDLLNMVASKRDTTAGPGAGTANTAGMNKTIAGLK